MLSHAQTNAHYRNYLLHPYTVNPAITGSEFFPVIVTSFSKQWAVISNSPGTQLISGSFRMGNFDFYNPKMFVNKTQLKAYERVGAGFTLFNDSEGPVSNRGGQLSYAFHIPFQGSRLALGLSANLHQFIVDERNFSPIVSNDPILTYGVENATRFNMNFGVYYYSPLLFTGLSVTDLLPLNNEPELNEPIKQDIHLLAGYRISLSSDIDLEPSGYVSLLDYNHLAYQLNARAYYRYIHWAQIHYRSTRELGLKAGIKISRIYLAYGYEASISRIFRYNLGTHSISLGANIGIRRIEGF